MKHNNQFPIEKSEAEWREILDEKRFHVLREKGTEYPDTGAFNLHFDNGQYVCAACANPVFESSQKFKSSCGWPSFDEAMQGSVQSVQDNTHGMNRTEIVCSNCGGHLGHVFNDGPTESGQRFCINSLSLDFKEGN